MSQNAIRTEPGAWALDAWVAAHGPIWPSHALVLALHVCAEAARMTRAELRSTIGSLSASSVMRQTSGEWSWIKTHSDEPVRRVTDGDVIERIGVVLFCCLTAATPSYPLDAADVLRARVRTLRPDIPAGIADLVVRAMNARGTQHTLTSFARTLRQALAPDAVAERRDVRRTAIVGAAAVLVVLLGVGVAVWRSFESRLQTNGLTIREATLLDVTEETAQTLAMMDEHTAAIQSYQEIARLWRSHVAPEDPRMTWTGAHEGWVRWLRGDGITTEQNLGTAPSRLDATLGNRHPYSRAARLGMAVALEARGAVAAAAPLRAQADRIAQELLGDANRAMRGVFAPTGVVAHVAPNAPELEGFRRAPNGRFFMPLTSIQRWFAGRDGWRLHAVANGSCRAEVVVGDVPRRFAIDVTRRRDRTWQVRTDGTAPLLDVAATSGDRIDVSLIADGAGSLQLRAGDAETRLAKLDEATPPPAPPFSLAFGDETGVSGCAVVWLEIPVPFQPASGS